MRLVRTMTILTLTLVGLGACDDDDDNTQEPVLPAIDAAPGGGTVDAAAGMVVDVAIHDDFFNPADVTVSAGGTVRWTHMGSHEHSVSSGESPAATDAGSMFDMDLENGDTFEVRFDDTGVQPYFCKYHFFSAGMKGTVTVQ